MRRTHNRPWYWTLLGLGSKPYEDEAITLWVQFPHKDREGVWYATVDHYRMEKVYCSEPLEIGMRVVVLGCDDEGCTYHVQPIK